MAGKDGTWVFAPSARLVPRLGQQFANAFSVHVWKEPCAVAIGRAESEVRAQDPEFVAMYDRRLRLIP